MRSLTPPNKLFVTLLCIACPSMLLGSAGTSGGDILSIPSGARAIAMGEAYTAQADDVSSLYWNPAGLGILNQSQASFLYNRFLQDQTYQNAAVATPIENGGIGGSLSYMSFGQINGFDAHANPTGDVNAYSTVGTLGGAMLLGPLSAGINLKGLQSKLADTSATGVAVDVGGIWTLQREVFGGTLRAGATIRNMGSGLNFIDQRDAFPLEWRLGLAAVQMMDRKLNISLDYGQVRDEKKALYTGVEYWVVSAMALRVGYAGTDQEGTGLRAGVGLRIRGFSFDYAYSAFGDLGMSQLFEVSTRFGVIQPRLTPEERALFKKAKLAMAEGRYDEATLLFDSLLTMEPSYRPFRRWIKVAMRNHENAEALAAAAPILNLRATEAGDTTMDVQELTDLIQTSEDVQKVAENRDATPKAEEAALAPLVPAQSSAPEKKP